MEKRYRILRFVSGFYKVIGIIIGVITLVSSLGICVTSVLGSSILSSVAQSLNNSGLPSFGGAGVLAGILAALGTIIGGALAALGTYAIGELITLFINMEENTRATAAMLHSRTPAPSQPLPQPPAQSQLPQ